MKPPATSKPLSVPRSGVARMIVTAKPVPIDPSGTLSREELIAAWGTPQDGSEGPGLHSTPKRVVIRIDGKIEDSKDVGGGVGFPCAVLNVRYTIGGFERNVLLDAVNQSALVVWAEAVDVTSVWDQRRIARLAAEDAPLNPCVSQLLAASISACQCGDEGPADARYLDVIAREFPANPELNEFSVHPVPNGARGFRFLDVLLGGDPISVPGKAVTITYWLNADQTGFIETVRCAPSDTAIIMVPVCARYLVITFPPGTLKTWDTPAWIEWIMAPNTLPALA